jgi:DNA-binding IclR family transcriptional regulator
MGWNLVFCSTEFNSELVQNYAQRFPSLSMKKPHKEQFAKRAKPPPKAAIVNPPVIKTDRHFVTALARGLEVLACFRPGDRVLGNQELSKRCGLAKSTVSRLTHTLTKLGYLIYVEESAKYSLGTATLSLGSTMLSRLDIRKLAHPLMQQLAEFGQCMVSLGSRDRLSMVYIDAVRGSAAITLSLDIGARIHIATSAMGRAYLTAVSEEERNDVMKKVRELADVNRWPELQRGVAKALRDIRELGVCCSFGEWQKDVNAIALPVKPGGGLPPMAINCGAPAYMVSEEFLLERVRPRLIALAHELETSLGTAG